MYEDDDDRCEGHDYKTCINDGKYLYDNRRVCLKCLHAIQERQVDQLSENDKAVFKALIIEPKCQLFVSYLTKIPCQDVKVSLDKLAALDFINRSDVFNNGDAVGVSYNKHTNYKKRYRYLDELMPCPH